jgi:DDE superfamily endonuclease
VQNGPEAGDAPEIAVHRRPGREIRRQLPPLAAGPEQVEDRVEHGAHVRRSWPAPGLRRWNVGHEQRPLWIRQVRKVPPSPHARPHAVAFSGDLTSADPDPTLCTRPLKLSTDPQFAARLRAIAGLYIDPPAHAVVLSVDEKSQIQALDRTQPGLPLKKGRCATMTHDYKRHGTTTLFAALDVLEGKVIGRCMQRHRHQEFIRFLNTIEATVPVGKVVHVILDNYATHKHPEVKRWLERHPRFVFHFTPTSCSWLNAVEGFFAKLTKRRLQRGVFRSITELQAAINRFIEEANHCSKPFVWTADPDKIIAAVNRGHQALDPIH